MSKEQKQRNAILRALLEGENGKTAERLERETQIPRASLNRRLGDLYRRGIIDARFVLGDRRVPIYFVKDKTQAKQCLQAHSFADYLSTIPSKKPIVISADREGVEAKVYLVHSWAEDNKLRGKLPRLEEKARSDLKKWLDTVADSLKTLAAKTKYKEIVVTLKIVT